MLKTQRGEIATALTLISVGLMLLGVVAGKVAVQQTTRIDSKAETQSTGYRLCTPAEEAGANQALIYTNANPKTNGCDCDSANKIYVRWWFRRNDSAKCDMSPYTVEDSTCKNILETAGFACSFTQPTSGSAPATTPPPAAATGPGTKKEDEYCATPEGLSGTCKSSCSSTSRLNDSRDCSSSLFCCQNSTPPAAGEIDCMGYTSASDCKTRTKCAEYCKSCTIIGGDPGYKCPTSSSATSSTSCTSCDNGKCIYHPEIDPRSGRAPANTSQCTDNGCINDSECISPRDRTCITNGESCADTPCCLGQTGQPDLKCNTDKICEPIPVKQIKCPDFTKLDGADGAIKACGSRGYEAVPFSGGYIAGENASSVKGALIPNCWRCNTQNYCDFGSEDCAIAGKPTPFLNPTKTPNQHGFYIDSDIYAYNQDNGVRFEFNINLHTTGCDGDVQLMQNGNNLGGLKGWNGPRGIQNKFSPSEANSPVLGNGQSSSITYTAKLVNYACSPRGIPDNQTDSITCNLRVSDKGYTAITGTGCNWANLNRPDDYKATARPTITPKPAGKTGTPGSTSSTCYQYSCPDTSGKKFSVKNGKMYDNDTCSSNPTDSFSEICSKKLGSGCDIVSGGGTGTGKCVDDQNQCDSKKSYDRWGPNGNQVSTILCQGQAGKLCCEPPGGFKPKQTGTIDQSPSSGSNQTTVGNDNTCYFDYPSSVTPNTSFSVTVKYVRKNLVDTTNPVLNFINEGSGSNPPPNKTWVFSKQRILNNNPNTWEESDWIFNNNKLPEGKYKLKFTHDKAEDGTTACSFTPEITVNAAGSSATSAPECSMTITSANILPACTTCWKKALDDKKRLDDIKCDDPNQKVNKYCQQESNKAECLAIKTSCASDCKNTADNLFLLKLQSYTNEEYDKVIAEIKAGHLTAIYTSLYVLNATRVPGLQRLFCDPFLGQCDFYYQNPQVGT